MADMTDQSGLINCTKPPRAKGTTMTNDDLHEERTAADAVRDVAADAVIEDEHAPLVNEALVHDEVCGPDGNANTSIMSSGTDVADSIRTATVKATASAAQAATAAALTAASKATARAGAVGQAWNTRAFPKLELTTLDIRKLNVPRFEIPRVELPKVDLSGIDSLKHLDARLLHLAGAIPGVTQVRQEAVSVTDTVKDTVSHAITLVREAVGI